MPESVAEVRASGASAAGVYQDPAGEFRTPLPAGWTVGREAMSKQVCEGTATDIRSGRDPITQLDVRTCAVNLDAASLREGYYRGKPQARAQDEEVAAELRGSNAAMLREPQGLSEQLAAQKSTLRQQVENPATAPEARQAAQAKLQQTEAMLKEAAEMMLAKEAGEAEYHDEAFEKARQQSVTLTIAQLRAFYPTFSSDLADLWVMTKTRPAAWLTDQKALALQFEHNAEIETWKGRLAIFDQLSDMAVTRKWAAEYTGLVAEFLQQKLLDLSIAEGRNEASRLLQRCREMWALAAHKQLLTERVQALVLEVQRALRRLGEN